jgi:hypothetical protein
MENTTREELIAALVTDRYSGYKDGDEAMLQTASDARLGEFRASAEANRTAVNRIGSLETEQRNLQARLKVAEDRVKASEQPLTEAEFLQRAPESFKRVLEGHKAEEDQTRDALVSMLKDCGANTEAELKTKSITELQTLAKYARVEVPDFSGKAMPTARNAEQQTYAAPDPYAAGLKALREQTH